MMARNANVPFKGRIQKRKTNHLQIITFGLQRVAGPYRCATQGHRAWPRCAQAGACRPRSRTKTRERAAPYLVRWAAAAVTDCSCGSPRRQQLKNTVTLCRGCECEVVHTSRRTLIDSTSNFWTKVYAT